MNQTQRQFLLNSIETQYEKERSALNERRPEEPNLNNYLTAAILDGSFTMKPMEEIRKTIRDQVIKLGKGKALISTHKDAWRSQDDIPNTISMPASVLFGMPPGYVEVKNQYDADLKKWEAEAEALSNSFEAMKIKVQLGSDKALSALVDQADELCSMSLTASSKLLIEGRK